MTRGFLAAMVALAIFSEGCTGVDSPKPTADAQMRAIVPSPPASGTSVSADSAPLVVSRSLVAPGIYAYAVWWDYDQSPGSTLTNANELQASTDLVTWSNALNFWTNWVGGNTDPRWTNYSTSPLMFFRLAYVPGLPSPH